MFSAGTITDPTF